MSLPLKILNKKNAKLFIGQKLNVFVAAALKGQKECFFFYENDFPIRQKNILTVVVKNGMIHKIL